MYLKYVEKAQLSNFMINEKVRSNKSQLEDSLMRKLDVECCKSLRHLGSALYDVFAALTIWMLFLVKERPSLYGVRKASNEAKEIPHWSQFIEIVIVKVASSAKKGGVNIDSLI